MKLKFIVALIVAGVMGLSSTPASAHNNPPFHYHVGEIQPFSGIVCKEEESAMHIFDTWIEVGVDLAQKVFSIYQSASECKFLVGYSAYFIEEITSEDAIYFDGDYKKVLVFSISPAGRREMVDFLVTWEDLGEPI